MRVNGPIPGDPDPRETPRARVGRALRIRVRAAVDAALTPHARAAEGLRGGIGPLQEEARHLHQLSAELSGWLRRRRAPFSAEMTVHEAWARHRGVRLVFARYHLPACDGCAVGVDETLEDAALGHGLALPELLAELNALLRG